MASSNKLVASPHSSAPTPDLEFSSRLNESDALMWNIERDPSLRTTIVAVCLLDRSPDWPRLRQRMIDLGRQVPRLRQRVVEAPLRLGPPTWQLDENFDIDYHLRRIMCPSPKNLRAVLDLTAPLAMAAFDKDRPLWEFTVVEGLTGGRAAFIQKIHHSFTDGVGAVRLSQLMFDDTPKPVAVLSTLAAHDAKAQGTIESAFASMAAEMRTASTLSQRAARALPGLLAAATRPDRLLASTVGGARSFAKLLSPVRQPLSPVMTGRGLSRRLDSFDVPLEAMLGAAHRAGCTLNDAFLAGASAGLHKYHARHGVDVRQLRVTMPINVRRPGDPPGSNKFVPARLAIPIGDGDAGERMRQLGALARSWRHEPALPFSDLIAGALNRLPIGVTTSIFGGMLKAIDFVATNVPGISHRVYLAGAEITREYAFAPPSGAALSIALLSHLDQCCIGLNVDTAAVPDVDELIACLRQGFADLVASKGAAA